MIEKQYDHGADHRHDHRNEEAGIFITEAGHQGAEQKAADHGADQAQRGIDDAAFAAPVDDLAGDLAGQGAEENPTQYEHVLKSK